MVHAPNQGASNHPNATQTGTTGGLGPLGGLGLDRYFVPPPLPAQSADAKQMCGLDAVGSSLRSRGGFACHLWTKYPSRRGPRLGMSCSPFVGVAAWPLAPALELILDSATMFQAPLPWM